MNGKGNQKIGEMSIIHSIIMYSMRNGVENDKTLICSNADFSYFLITFAINWRSRKVDL